MIFKQYIEMNIKDNFTSYSHMFEWKLSVLLIFDEKEINSPKNEIHESQVQLPV